MNFSLIYILLNSEFYGKTKQIYISQFTSNTLIEEKQYERGFFFFLFCGTTVEYAGQLPRRALADGIDMPSGRDDERHGGSHCATR